MHPIPHPLLRKAHPEEAEAVFALYQSVIGSPFSVWDAAYPGMCHIQQDLKAKTLYVLAEGNKLLGTLSVVPENELDDFPFWQCRDGSQREIARVAVAREARGRGLAEGMVRSIAEAFFAEGCGALHLSVEKGHLPAIKTYRKVGFSPVGEAELYGSRYFLMELMSTNYISEKGAVLMEPMDYMKEAIAEAYEGIRARDGGPFGSVIVRDGKIVGRGHNRVLVKRDPTCHGEMEAIRDACANLGTHDLSGCTLYTTAEPCPMCLGATLWSNIRTLYYGCSRKDTDEIGFRDDAFYDYLDGKNQLLTQTELGRADCRELFMDYVNLPEKELY